MSSYEDDRLENEKNDPSENSSLKFINVPLILLSLFLGFGVSYLALKTDKIVMDEGDDRTKTEAVVTKKSASGNEQAMPEGIDLMTKGKKVYTITCQACHQASGNGIAGAFPPLVGSPWVTGSKQRITAIVLHGIQGDITVNGKKFSSVMPGFKAQLTDLDIAAVTTYVRNKFGGGADALNEKLVKGVRSATKDKTASWQGEKELNSQTWDQ